MPPAKRPVGRPRTQPTLEEVNARFPIPAPFADDYDNGHGGRLVPPITIFHYVSRETVSVGTREKTLWTLKMKKIDSTRRSDGLAVRRITRYFERAMDAEAHRQWKGLNDAENPRIVGASAAPTNRAAIPADAPGNDAVTSATPASKADESAIAPTNGAEKVKSAGNGATVMESQSPAIDSDELVGRINAEAQRLAQLTPGEWRLWYKRGAERFGIDPDELARLVQEHIKTAERAAKGENEREKTEDRNERRRQSKEKSRTALFRRCKTLKEDQRRAEIGQWCRTYGEDPDVVTVEYSEFCGGGTDDSPRAIEEMHPEPVDGNVLMQRISDRIARHIAVTPKRITVCSAWVFVAHLHRDVAIHSPFLVIHGPASISGKTELLHVLSYIVPRRNVIVKPTISLYHSTNREESVFIEEGQRLFENKDLVDIIDSSHTRGSSVTRIIKAEERRFNLFSPKALSILGGRNIMRPATATRCWWVYVLPKKDEEFVEAFAYQDDADLAEIRRMAARWAADNAETLKISQKTVAMPDEFKNDRVRDCWRLAFAVADAIGGEWPKRVRDAAVSTLPKVEPAIPWHIRAAQDLRKYVDVVCGNPYKSGPISSERFVTWLLADPDSEWHRYQGRKVNQWDIGYLFRSFYEINSKPVGPKDENRWRGWRPEWFAEIFARVVKHPLPTAQPLTPKRIERVKRTER
jgi:hypothetical protein